MPAPGAAPPEAAAKRAVALAFGASGFGLASFATRVPALAQRFALEPGSLGVVLLALSGGAVLALSLSGGAVHQLGAARALLAGGVLLCTGMTIVATCMDVATLAAGLGLVGLGNGVWDVSMNVEAATVERRLHRAIMPRFHAGWSIGSVLGAIGGGIAAAAGIGVGAHLLTVAAVVACAVLFAGSRFLPTPLDEPRATASGRPPSKAAGAGADGARASAARAWRSGTLAAWRERRTLLLGLFVLGMALVEGTANDWLALGFVRGYGAGHALAAGGLTLFILGMTATRMAGPSLLVRHRLAVLLRASAVAVAAGVLLVIAGAHLAGDGRPQLAAVAAVVGTLAWGAGAALGFPSGISAAADESDRAAARVSVVSTIGYTGFLGGPPLLGVLANRYGVVDAYLAVVVAVALTLSTARAVAPEPRSGR